MTHGLRTWNAGTALVLWIIVGAMPAKGQAFSPGESQIVIPTAETRSDARMTIGYGQKPNEVSSPPSTLDPERRSYSDEIYAITLQFIPRVSLHYRQSFKRADFVQATGDRVLGAQVTALKESGWRPGFALGIRDAGGTRKHHTTYAVATKGFQIDDLRASGTIGYSKEIFDASFLEMEDGVFGGINLRAWNRVELMADYDTRYIYAGARVWPLRWVWVTGFVAEWEHPGFAFGISRVLRGSTNAEETR